jgi:hypothetical protein
MNSSVSKKVFCLKAATACRMKTAHDLATACLHEKKIKVKGFGVVA